MIENIESSWEANKKRYKKLVLNLKNKPENWLYKNFQSANDKTFAKINCLECANCCKTTGPLFTKSDINRIAKHFSLKPNGFIQKYLRLDEDGDHVLKSVPCPFLGSDNHCSIYKERPKACREYPHTNQANQKKLLHLHLKNAAICPAIHEIFRIIEEEK